VCCMDKYFWRGRRRGRTRKARIKKSPEGQGEAKASIVCGEENLMVYPGGEKNK